MATNAEIAALLYKLQPGWPRFTLELETIQRYVDVLTDLPVEAIATAVTHLLTVGGNFYPTPREVRETSIDMLMGIHQVPSEFEAWQDVKEQMRKCGRFFDPCHRLFRDGQFVDEAEQTPAYRHELICAAVEAIGGYRFLYECEDPEGVTRANFYKIYRALFERAKADLMMLPKVREQSEQLAAGRADGSIRMLTEKLGDKFGRKLGEKHE